MKRDDPEPPRPLASHRDGSLATSFLLAATVLCALASTACVGDGISGEVEKGGGLPWQPRNSSWTAESGLRHEAGDGSARQWRHETEIESNEKLNSSSGYGRQDGEGCGSETVIIHVDGRHPLLGLAAEQMVTELQTLPGVHSIICIGRGEAPEPGIPQPDIDVFLRLSTPVTVDEVDGKYEIQAGVRCHAERAKADRDTLIRAPRMSWMWHGDLKHRSTTEVQHTEGLSAPVFRSAAQAIGKQFGAALTKHVGDLQGKYGAPHPTPEALRVAWTPTPDLPWPEGLNTRLRSSYLSDLTSNRTTWEIESADGIEPLLVAFAESLEQDGWARTPRWKRKDSALGFSLRRGEEQIRFTWGARRGGPVVVRPGEDPPPLQQGRIVYTAGVNEDELKQRLQALDPGTCDPAWLLFNQRHLSRDQQRQLLARLETKPPRSWEALISVATLQHALGLTEGVLATMRRAACLAWIEMKEEKLATAWRSRAETWGLPPEPPEPPGREDLVHAGVTLLEAGGEAKWTVGLDETVYAATESVGGLWVITLRLEANPEPEQDPHRLYHHQRSSGSASWGHQPLLGGQFSWGIQEVSGEKVMATATRIREEPPRFEVRVSFSH